MRDIAQREGLPIHKLGETHLYTYKEYARGEVKDVPLEKTKKQAMLKHTIPRHKYDADMIVKRLTAMMEMANSETWKRE